MTMTARLIEGGVTTPAGFTAAGVYCGIKKPNPVTHPLDLCLIASTRGPVPAAAVFTTNLAVAAPAVAGPFTTVPSAADPGDPIDLHLTLDWELRLGRGQITRERVGLASVAPTDPIPEVRDLLLESSRHTLRAGAELGVFHDTWLSLGLPIVISDQRALLFDQQDTPCSFAGAGATCVNADNSPTVLDGLLPARGYDCLLYTSPSPRDRTSTRMPSSA